MIQTFRDAGYRVVSEYEEGVLQLEFPIDPTDTAIGLMSNREHRAESASIEKFFNPRSVAVIGASRRQETIGQALVRNLVTGDFAGRVYAVNPTSHAVSGLPTYKTVSDIPDEVDVAIVAVPAESVQDVVLDCAAKGVHGLVVDLLGLRRDRRGGPDAAAQAGRALPLLRPAADRTELPRASSTPTPTSRSTPRSRR